MKIEMLPVQGTETREMGMGSPQHFYLTEKKYYLRDLRICTGLGVILGEIIGFILCAAYYHVWF